MLIKVMDGKRIDIIRRIEITHASAQAAFNHALKHSAAALAGPWGAISQ